MAFRSQSQSSFVTRLPSEVREAIYLELWRCVGLRQHLVSHARYSDEKLSEVHLARWPCKTGFYVGDRLQEEVDALPIEMFNSLGNVANKIPYQRRNWSKWMDHWACEESFFECVVENWDSEQFEKPEEFDEHDCWCSIKKEMAANRKDSSALGSHMAMLLTCKLISSECLRSIYQSTTFIVTDYLAIQGLFGSCNTHPILRAWRGSYEDRIKPPPAFLQYARHIEISLDRNYPLHHRCCWTMATRKQADENLRCEEGEPSDDLEPEVHEPCDFHCLHLERFESLRSLKIWIATSNAGLYGGLLTHPTGIEEMDFEKLRTLLSGLANLDLESVILSAPLHKSMEPDKGYVEGIAENGKLKVWKRGQLIPLGVKWSMKVR
ncbi:hypothetical protein NCS52_00312200 [Fusarium sp. LHS14.1]|nr:hypothetical protein NCS52_00312200 [Fusarium sp. LHS14.1]